MSTTEWAKGIVFHGSAQIKAIGIQIVATGGSNVESAKESMLALVEANKTQITSEYEKVDSSVTIAVDHAKVAPEHVTKVVKHDHKKAQEKKEKRAKVRVNR